MKTKNALLTTRKILIPVLGTEPPQDALALARMLAPQSQILLVGFIHVSANEDLSSAALPARQLRQRLHTLSETPHLHCRHQVHVVQHPWRELLQIIQKERPHLLILEWPQPFQTFQPEVGDPMPALPCDTLLIRGPLPTRLTHILTALRGGPGAELALRTALTLARNTTAQVTSLHIETTHQEQQAFKGLAQVLDRLPEVKQLQISTSNPAAVILTQSQNTDLLVIGATAPPTAQFIALGPVARRILSEAAGSVLIVRPKERRPVNYNEESAGQTAISVLVDKWFAEKTFHAEEFADMNRLLDLKRRQKVTISLALPALNEEATIGNVIQTIKQSLMTEIPLLDEIVLMDSNSNDRTREIAAGLGIPIHIHQETLPQYGARRGKGEALWKSLLVTHGDIVLWIDTDIVNIHPRFVYGLLGPFLLDPEVQFVKGFYQRPLKVGDKFQIGGGGRVTELTARPLLNLFYPELSGVIQPLAGEYGGRRAALEQLGFFSGYGVEIGLLIDIFEKYGLQGIAQVDLLERIHHNQPLEALSKMSFAIIQAVVAKLERRYGRSMLEDINRTMKFIRQEPERFALEVQEISELARPPMLELTEYRERSR